MKLDCISWTHSFQAPPTVSNQDLTKAVKTEPSEEKTGEYVFWEKLVGEATTAQNPRRCRNPPIHKLAR